MDRSLAYLLGPLALALVAFLGFRAVRSMKGAIKLDLTGDSASSGEFLSGRVSFATRRPARGQLKVSLLGKVKQDGDSGNMSEVYRQDQVLEETRDFPAGFTRTYDFELAAPTSSEARRGDEIMKQMGELAGGADAGAMGSVLKLALSAGSMVQRRIYWYVESRLDADGIDLVRKRRVRINLRDEIS